jgi:hypothetical protein
VISITAATLRELHEEVARVCHGGKTNVLLGGTYELSEFQSSFVNTYVDVARHWQAPERRPEYRLNHGEYMNRGGQTGVDFLIEELKRKKTSNRACVSLVSMSDLVNSGDAPIPSFMILQAGFDLDYPGSLVITEYFRALEVIKFLPINLAETALIVRALAGAFPEIRSVVLSIVAYRAHSRPSFTCFVKAELDRIAGAVVTRAVAEKESDRICQWLEEKRLEGVTVVDPSGIVHVLEALDVYCGASATYTPYSPAVADNLREALGAMKQLEEMRKRSSHMPELEGVQKQIEEAIDAAIREVRSSGS